MPRSAISSETFLTSLPKEWKLPPLKNSFGNGVVGPPLQHPATQRYTFSRNNPVAEEGGLALSLNVENEVQDPSRGLSWKDNDS